MENYQSKSFSNHTVNSELTWMTQKMWDRVTSTYKMDANTSKRIKELRKQLKLTKDLKDVYSVENRLDMMDEMQKLQRLRGQQYWEDRRKNIQARKASEWQKNRYKTGKEMHEADKLALHIFKGLSGIGTSISQGCVDLCHMAGRGFEMLQQFTMQRKIQKESNMILEAYRQTLLLNLENKAVKTAKAASKEEVQQEDTVSKQESEVQSEPEVQQEEVSASEEPAVQQESAPVSQTEPEAQQTAAPKAEPKAKEAQSKADPVSSKEPVVQQAAVSQDENKKKAAPVSKKEPVVQQTAASKVEPKPKAAQPKAESQKNAAPVSKKTSEPKPKNQKTAVQAQSSAFDPTKTTTDAKALREYLYPYKIAYIADKQLYCGENPVDKKKFALKAEWKQHKFTPQEVVDLFAGKSVEILNITSINGETMYDATCRIGQYKKQDGQVAMGIATEPKNFRSLTKESKKVVEAVPPVKSAPVQTIDEMAQKYDFVSDEITADLEVADEGESILDADELAAINEAEKMRTAEEAEQVKTESLEDQYIQNAEAELAAKNEEQEEIIDPQEHGFIISDGKNESFEEIQKRMREEEEKRKKAQQNQFNDEEQCDTQVTPF